MRERGRDARTQRELQFEKSTSAPAGRVLPGKIKGIQVEIKTHPLARPKPMSYLKKFRNDDKELVEKRSPKTRRRQSGQQGKGKERLPVDRVYHFLQ